MIYLILIVVAIILVPAVLLWMFTLLMDYLDSINGRKP